jgi:hypothetical protein
MAGSWVGEYKVRVERPERPRRCKYCIRTALTHTLISGPGVSVSIFTCRDHYRLLTVGVSGAQGGRGAGGNGHCGKGCGSCG